MLGRLGAETTAGRAAKMNCHGCGRGKHLFGTVQCHDTTQYISVSVLTGRQWLHCGFSALKTIILYGSLQVLWGLSEIEELQLPDYAVKMSTKFNHKNGDKHLAEDLLSNKESIGILS